MKVMLFANTAWYLFNFRLATAQRLVADGHDVLLVSPPDEHVPRLQAAGLRWRALPLHRASLNPLREAATLAALVDLLRAERPDVLHNFTVKCAVYGSLAARVTGVPAVINAIAGMGYVYAGSDLRARLLRPCVAWLLRSTLDRRRSLLVLQNPDDAVALVKAQLVDPLRVRVILGSGVDTARFTPAVRREGRLRVVLASRLLREKGVVEYVEAARMLKQAGRDIEFVLSGRTDPGNPHSIPEAWVRQWHQEGIVACLGHVDDMPSLLASADVMVLPSYYGEGVPRCLIEGAAAGLAVITTDRPGCREVVKQDGVDGLHVPCRNAAALARAIARLDDDRPLLRRLGARARRNAVECFDQAMVLERTLAVYDELLALRQLTA
jgi:glycosyltransferase involved in cell wall biosynthesis